MDDQPAVKIGKHFDKVTSKMFDTIKTGGKVMVICRAGKSCNLAEFVIDYKSYLQNLISNQIII